MIKCKYCDKLIKEGILNYIEHKQNCESTFSTKVHGYDFYIYVGSDLYNEFNKILKNESERLYDLSNEKE